MQPVYQNVVSQIQILCPKQIVKYEGFFLFFWNDLDNTLLISA